MGREEGDGNKGFALWDFVLTAVPSGGGRGGEARTPPTPPPFPFSLISAVVLYTLPKSNYLIILTFILLDLPTGNRLMSSNIIQIRRNADILRTWKIK